MLKPCEGILEMIEWEALGEGKRLVLAPNDDSARRVLETRLHPHLSNSYEVLAGSHVLNTERLKELLLKNPSTSGRISSDLDTIGGLNPIWSLCHDMSNVSLVFNLFFVHV